MSDVMLLGVLCMPPSLWSGDAMDVSQRHQRYLQAAKRIQDDEQELERLRNDVSELAFYREHGFPYLDHYHYMRLPMGAERSEDFGMYAIKLPMGWPNPDGEGTTAAYVLHAFTVERLYERAQQWIAELGPRPESTATLTPAASAATAPDK